jgi:hypothetical protein
LLGLAKARRMLHILVAVQCRAGQKFHRLPDSKVHRMHCNRSEIYGALVLGYKLLVSIR